MKISPLLLMLLTLALGMATLALLDGEQQPPLAEATITNADYQRCVRIDPGPLDGPAPGKLRTDYRTRNGGIA